MRRAISLTTLSRRITRLVILFGLLVAPPVAAQDRPSGTRPEEVTALNNRGVTEARAGRFDAGAQLLRKALAIDPTYDAARISLSGILTDWAIQLVDSGQVDQAEGLFREAVKRNPDNGMAIVRLGDLYYFHQSRFDEAILWWKRAHGLVPSHVWRVVADRLSQAERDRHIERTFESSPTSHFDIRVQDPSHAAVTTLKELLEEEYEALREVFGASPTRITVIVYTAQELQRLHNQRDWFIGFYDGRLRLRWNEVLMGQGTRPVVAHELAHAFLAHVYGPGLPTWVHEGFAQLREGPRVMTKEEQRIEEGVKARTQWIPLAWIDRRFSQPSAPEDVGRAYVESRLVVQELVRRYGMDRFQSFLAQLASGQPIERSFDETFAPARWVRANQGVFD